MNKNSSIATIAPPCFHEEVLELHSAKFPLEKSPGYEEGFQERD